MKIEVNVIVWCTCGNSLVRVRDEMIDGVCHVTVSPCPNPECRRRQEEDHAKPYPVAS
jgi:hypothetical protein